MQRRQFIKSVLAGGLLVFGAAQGAATPNLVTHVPDVARAFASTSENEVLAALFGTTRSLPSGQLRLHAPFIATPGLGAQIKVRADLPDAKSLAIIVRDVARPLAAYVRLSGARTMYSSTLALNKTSQVSVYVMTDHGVFSQSMHIKVTRGGYGTNF